MSAPAAARERVQQLRRMKMIAGGLLVVAAVVFVVCVTVGDGRGVWGYLQATAEAAMVGGFADWFAVTALFRHPLGLPIPHTAIIPRKKDQLGGALAGFVQQNFLTGAVVSERLRAAEIPRRLGEWLAAPEHAARVAADVGSGVSGAAAVLRDDELRAAVLGYVERRLHAIPAAPLAARGIDALRESGQHQVVLTAVLRGLMRFLNENRAVLRERLEQESPEWIPVWVDNRVFNRAFVGLQSFIADVITQPEHSLRQGFDQRLREYAQELRTDPDTAARAELVKNSLLERPDVRDWLASLWGNLKLAVVAESADPRSQLQRGLAHLIEQLGRTLVDDATLRAKADAWLTDVVQFLLSHYERDVSELISATVARWDAADTGRRIELQVGRDLQFIRVNGTVVGALVGVVIYAVSRVL